MARPFRILTSPRLAPVDLYQNSAEDYAHVVAKSAFFGIAYSLNAEGASLSISGTSAGVKKGSVVQAGTQATAITGTPASLKRSCRIGAGFEVVTITGQPADLIYTTGGTDYVLDAAGGSMSIQGQPISFLFALRMIASGGSIILDPGQISLRQERRMYGEGGTIILSGNEAAIRRMAWLMSGSGSYVITGQDIEFFLNLPRELFTIAGRVKPGYSRHVDIDPDLDERTTIEPNTERVNPMGANALTVKIKSKQTLNL